MRKRRWPVGQGIALMLEAQQVIARRMAKLASGGPAARAEAERMVAEKVRATGQVSRLLAGGVARGNVAGGAADAVRLLRRAVRANNKRLRGEK